MNIIETIEKYYTKIYNICLFNTEHDVSAAENCTNEVFITLVLKWEDAAKKDLYRWLLKTTDYKLKEYYRKKKKDSIIIPLENAEEEIADRT